MDTNDWIGHSKLRRTPPRMCQSMEAGSAGSGVFLLAALVLCCVPSAVAAQKFKSLPFDDRARINNRGIAQQCVRNPDRYAAEKGAFTEYFAKYYFPVMTQAAPERLAELGELRFDLFRRYLWPAQSADLQNDLTRMALTYTRDVVPNPAYHPAVRYNAILVLGLLDAKYAGATGESPEPLQEATAVLLKVVQAAGKHPSVTPPLLVGALVGLERHAQYYQSLPQPLVRQMESTLVNFIVQEEPPGEMSTEVLSWIKRHAANALTYLGTTGENNRVHDTIVALMDDDEDPLQDRCANARLLQKLDYSSANVDGAAAVDSIVALTNEFCQEQSEKAQEFQDMHLPGGRRLSGRSRPSYGNYGGGFRQNQLQFERRPLIECLDNLNAGLKAVAKIASDDAKSQVEQVIAIVGPVLSAAKEDETLDLELASQVKGMAAEVNNLARSREPAADDVEDVELEASTEELSG